MGSSKEAEGARGKRRRREGERGQERKEEGGGERKRGNATLSNTAPSEAVRQPFVSPAHLQLGPLVHSNPASGLVGVLKRPQNSSALGSLLPLLSVICLPG